MPPAPRAVDLPILGPCPSDVALERDPAVTRVFCDECRKDVHVLSHMTKAEAQAFLTAHAGERLCVSYVVDERGAIRFRAPHGEPSSDGAEVPRDLVPATRLSSRARTHDRKPPTPSHARVAAAASVAAIAIACTPTSRPSDARAEAALREPPRWVARERRVDPATDARSLHDDPCDDLPSLVPGGGQPETTPTPPDTTRRPPERWIKRGMLERRLLRGDVALPD